MHGSQTNSLAIRFDRLRLGIFSLLALGFVISSPPLLGQDEPSKAQDNWHHWRGPNANGVSNSANPPIEWGEESNVQWKVEVEGRGSSTPIIWEDKVFLLTVVDTGDVDPSLPKPEDQPDRIFGIKYPNSVHEFVVLCLNRQNGEVLWRQVASRMIPHEGHHGDNDFASASPTTDGERLYCWFGSAGLYCYNLEGDKQWERQLGKAYMGASLGEGCSPVVHGDRLVIVRDQARQSYIEVLDTKSGETKWKKDRDEPNGWATPLVVEHDGQTQVITSGSNFIRSYDLSDGEIVWQCGGLTSNHIPCPVILDDQVICMTGYEGDAALAIEITAEGDVTDSNAILWSKNRGTPYVPSPLLYDDMLYFTQSNQAVLSCLNAQTGDEIIPRTRLPELANVYSSPVGAQDRVYICGRGGTTLVLEKKEDFRVLATNKIDDRIVSSPALSGNQFFVRGTKYLYCFAEE